MELTQRSRLDVAGRANSAASVGRALEMLSDADVLRLRALARLRARGLPHGIGWSDLLHEAVARALDGSRQWPQGVPLLVLAGGAAAAGVPRVGGLASDGYHGTDSDRRG